MAKQKLEMKVECLNQHNFPNGSNCTFAQKADKQPTEQRQVIARKTAQFNWDDDTGRVLIPGKQYKITIEEL